MSNWLIDIGVGTAVESWGAGRVVRFFPDDLLGGCFERTLTINRMEKSDVEWLFTGPRAGVTLRIGPKGVTLAPRYYDSSAFHEQGENKPYRHPEWTATVVSIATAATPRTITLRADFRLNLILIVDGQEVHRMLWVPDLSRHQLRLSDADGVFNGQIAGPAVAEVSLTVDAERSFQTMIGFGGTAAPAAYAMLSEQGKRQWWRMVVDYNLLIQREYPVGRQLRPEMDNWDWNESATPHYYGDNFPNSEVSDFDYVRRIRALGGQVWFEFWHLPPWAENDPARYAAAVVAYCRTSTAKAGAPPDVVGIQNEVGQSDEMWQQMTLALRAALDAAGFANVRIHMSDDGWLGGASRRAEALKKEPASWSYTDYAASHCYDYQNHVRDPDAYDATFAKFKAATDHKPFLATEVCVNVADYQHDSYRMSLSMAQLYHKNLALGDAVALCYCWTLLNVVQPTYGQTRALCVPDETRSMTPRASSSQLRSFGAFSRHVRRGMTRVATASPDPNLLSVAFCDDDGRATLVIVNRAHHASVVNVRWPGVTFTRAEIADPYNENAPAHTDGLVPTHVQVPPGAILTLTNVGIGSASSD